MSRPVKELLRKELARRFEGMTSLVVVGFTGIDGSTTHRIRHSLREKEVRMTVVKNALARQAFDSIGLPQVKNLIDGPCALAFSTDSARTSAVDIVRELLEIGKETPNLKVKAALLDGKAFGPERIEELSKFPTYDEAIGGIATSLVSPGRMLGGVLTGPGGRIAAMLKAISEKGRTESDSSGEQAA